MNAAATEIVITYERKKEVRQRIGRPMKDYVDGRKSVKALAEAMDKFNAETTGDGAANITSADMPRRCRHEIRSHITRHRICAAARNDDNRLA